MPARDRASLSPFFGPDGRLHPILRLLLYCLATPAAVVVMQFVAYTIVSSIVGPPSRTATNLGEMGFPFLLSLQLGSVVAITGATFVACRLLDVRSLVSLGLRRRGPWVIDVVLGLALGLVLMGLIFLMEWRAGWLEWRLATVAFSLTDLAGAALLFVMVAWGEELAMRGYVLQTAAEAWGMVPATVLTSMLFSILHLANPSANFMSVLGIFMAGVFFAVAFWTTRSLWLPMATHFSWNFFEGPLFGFPVSGLQLPSLFSVTPKGPDLVTGGAFGPEAGLSGILATCVGIAALLGYWRWRQPRL